MKFSEWQSLLELEQIDRCQELSPYSDENLMEEIKKHWIDTFGKETGITDLHIGSGPGVGPYNCIVLRIPEDKKKQRLPAYFMGFPLLRRYASGRIYTPNLSQHLEKIKQSNQALHSTPLRSVSEG